MRSCGVCRNARKAMGVSAVFEAMARNDGAPVAVTCVLPGNAWQLAHHARATLRPATRSPASWANEDSGNQVPIARIATIVSERMPEDFIRD